jgi:hypothetical protein
MVSKGIAVFFTAAVVAAISGTNARSESGWSYDSEREWAAFATEICLRRNSVSTTTDLSDENRAYVAWETVAAGACCLGGYLEVQDALGMSGRSDETAGRLTLTVPSAIALIGVSDEWSHMQIFALVTAARAILRSDALAYASLTSGNIEVPEHITERLRASQTDCADYGSLLNLNVLLEIRSNAAEGKGTP